MNTWYFLIKRDPGVIICSQPFWSSFLSLPLFFISGQSARPSKPLILNTGVKHLAWPGCCSSLFLMWFGSFFYSNQSKMAFCRCMKIAGSIKPLILAMPMVLRWAAAGQHHSYLNWFLLHWYQCLYFQYSIGPNSITPESAWTTNSIKIDRVGFTEFSLNEFAPSSCLQRSCLAERRQCPLQSSHHLVPQGMFFRASAYF